MSAPRSRAPGRRWRPDGIAALAAVATLVCSACTSAGGSSEAATSPDVSSSPSASAALTPLDRAPGDFRKVAGNGFTLAAPSVFQESATTGSNGQPVLTLRRPSSVPALPSTVAVLRDVGPGRDVVQQMTVLEVSKRNLTQVSDLRRADVTWPGARRAVLVRWAEKVPLASGQRVDVRYWQLAAQVDDQLILNVVALAPAADFDAAALADVVRTFRPSG